MSCVGVVFSNGTLLLVCGEQSLSLQNSGDFHMIPLVKNSIGYVPVLEASFGGKRDAHLCSANSVLKSVAGGVTGPGVRGLLTMWITWSLC